MQIVLQVEESGKSVALATIPLTLDVNLVDNVLAMPIVFTDSTYGLQCLLKGWSLTLDLEEVRDLAQKF